MRSKLVCVVRVWFAVAVFLTLENTRHAQRIKTFVSLEARAALTRRIHLFLVSYQTMDKMNPRSINGRKAPATARMG